MIRGGTPALTPGAEQAGLDLPVGPGIDLRDDLLDLPSRRSLPVASRETWTIRSVDESNR